MGCATGFLPATRTTASGQASTDEKEAPTGILAAPGQTDVDGEAPTDYSPYPGRGAASGPRREDGPLETRQKFGRYGIKFITMPYAEGVDLSSILKTHERGLPVEQVLTVARGVVSGLVAAHRAGVVRRDLKPAKIIVENGTGQAMITDFGIARSSSSADPGAKPGVTLSSEFLAS